MAPRRPLTLYEAEYVGELQAYRLLELAGLTRPPVPSSLIAELPRVEVRYDVDLPVSGTTLWDNGRWVITVCASEPSGRMRFTLAHELKHAVDHRHRLTLYVDKPGLPASVQSERAADHFAAALLMPKRWVRQSWVEGRQRVSVLSQLYGVSPQAMRVRLQRLGLLAAPVDDQRQDGDKRPAYQRLARPVGGPRT